MSSVINTVEIHTGDERDLYVDATDLVPEGRTIVSATVSPTNGNITLGSCTVFLSPTPVGDREVAAGKGFYFRVSGASVGKRDLTTVMVLDNDDRLGGTLPLRCS